MYHLLLKGKAVSFGILPHCCSFLAKEVKIWRLTPADACCTGWQTSHPFFLFQFKVLFCDGPLKSPLYNTVKQLLSPASIFQNTVLVSRPMRGPGWACELSDWTMELSGCYLPSQDLFGELDWTGPPGCPPVLYNMASSEVSFHLQTLTHSMPMTMMTMNMQVSEVLGYSEEIVGSEDIMESQLDLPVECVQVQRETHPHPVTNPTAFQETIVTDSSFHLGDQIIYGDELIVTSEDVPQSEEIVGGGPDSDPYVGLYESVPIPNIDSGNKFGVNSFVGSKKQKNSKVKREFDLESLSEGRLKNSASWQQKQVSIKTLEGEFSVTMWASGADDGKCLR